VEVNFHVFAGQALTPDSARRREYRGNDGLRDNN
jgi:hypothetical protein